MLFRESIAALYRGMESKLIQTVLTSAFMFATYEHIVSLLFLLLGELAWLCLDSVTVIMHPSHRLTISQLFLHRNVWIEHIFYLCAYVKFRVNVSLVLMLPVHWNIELVRTVRYLAFAAIVVNVAMDCESSLLWPKTPPCSLPVISQQNQYNNNSIKHGQSWKCTKIDIGWG